MSSIGSRNRRPRSARLSMCGYRGACALRGSRYHGGMPSGFSPHFTARIADRLLFGRDGDVDPGLLARWSGRDVGLDLAAREEFMRQVRRLLGFHVRDEALRNTCGPLLGVPIEPGRLIFWCWHVAANREVLKAGREVPCKCLLWGKLWAPVEIVHAKPGQSIKGVFGIILTFRVIDGPMCSVHFERWFPRKFLWILARELGLTTWRDRPGRFTGEPAQLVGMRLTVNLMPRDPHATEPSDRIMFERFKGEAFRNYNRRLVRERQKPCPAGYRWACHKCTLGRDFCPAGESGSLARACRPVSLVQRGCLQCRQDTWHDAGTCMECRRRSPPLPEMVSYVNRIPPSLVAV